MVVDAPPLENQASRRVFGVLIAFMAKHSLQEIGNKIQGRILGDPTVSVIKLSSIANADETSLVFADSPASLEKAVSSKAVAVIAGEVAGGTAGKKPLIICKQPKLAF